MRVLRTILGALRLLAWLLTAPLLWLARRATVRALRRVQRRQTMAQLRQLAEWSERASLHEFLR